MVNNNNNNNNSENDDVSEKFKYRVIIITTGSEIINMSITNRSIR